MFCGKCGTEVQNNCSVAFCPNCGERLVSKLYNGQIINKTKNLKQLKIFIPILIAIIAIIAAVVIVSSNKNDYENVIDNYFKAIETHDISLMKSTLADYWLDYQIADYDTEEYLLEDLEDLIDDEIDDYDCGENIEIVSYTITGAIEADEDDLTALKDNIYDWYAYYVYSEDEFNSSIKDAYVLNIRFRVSGDEGANILTTKRLVVKENGKWKLTLGGLDNSFYSNY